MSTENGVVRLGDARRYTERLRSRAEHLAAKVAEREAEGLPVAYEAAELAALRWAIPLMEAEGDFIARFRTEILPAEVAAHPSEHDRRAVDA